MIGKYVNTILTTILTTTFITVLLTYSLWHWIKIRFDIKIFYIGTAIGFVGYTYVIHLLLKQQQRSKWIIALSEIIYLTTINKLVDEMFFDPTKFNINDYLGFGIIILITIYKYNKKNGYNDATRTKNIL